MDITKIPHVVGYLSTYLDTFADEMRDQYDHETDKYVCQDECRQCQQRNEYRLHDIVTKQIQIFKPRKQSPYIQKYASY